MKRLLWLLLLCPLAVQAGPFSIGLGWRAVEHPELASYEATICVPAINHCEPRVAPMLPVETCTSSTVDGGLPFPCVKFTLVGLECHEHRVTMRAVGQDGGKSDNPSNEVIGWPFDVNGVDCRGDQPVPLPDVEDLLILGAGE